MKYAELVALAKRSYVVYENNRAMSTWGIHELAKAQLTGLDWALFLGDNLEMACDMIDESVGLNLNEDDYQKREIEVSLEDVLRELLEGNLRGVLQAEWDNSRRILTKPSGAMR